MQNWKDALWLAKFELQVSKKNFLFALVFFAFITADMMLNFSEYLGGRLILIDGLFLVIFTVGPSFTRPKEFQSQRINNDLVASPTFILMNQLPVKRDIMVKSRFINYALFTFPFQIMLLIMIYAVDPEINNMISPGQFAAFTLIWLSFGIYVGYAIPAGDAGDNANSAKTFIYSVLLIAGIAIVVMFFNFTFSNSMVYWSIVLAQKWPVLSSITSILFAVLGFNYWQKYMKKATRKVNYL